MVTKVCDTPTIYRIEVPLPNNPLKYLNSYVIKGRERSLVIDTGFRRPECREALQQGLQELDVDLSRVDLFLTHLHSDHTGLVNDFDAAGSTIYMSQIDYDFLYLLRNSKISRFTLERYSKEGLPSENINNYMSNQAVKYSADYNFNANLVHDGDILHFADLDFQVIEVPGHTKGLCCLYLPQQEILFTSDHILFDITPNITIWSNMKHALRLYLESLDKVRNLPVRLALPGHREGDTSIVGRVDMIKEHHHKRLAEALEIIQRMPGLTAYEIASYMTWSMRGKTWEEFPMTQKWFALGECLSHLEYLLDEGKIQCRERDGKNHYIAF